MLLINKMRHRHPSSPPSARQSSNEAPVKPASTWSKISKTVGNIATGATIAAGVLGAGATLYGAHKLYQAGQELSRNLYKVPGALTGTNPSNPNPQMGHTLHNGVQVPNSFSQYKKDEAAKRPVASSIPPKAKPAPAPKPIMKPVSVKPNVKTTPTLPGGLPGGWN